MDTAVIDDLKQFITALFSQQFALFRQEMDLRFAAVDQRFEVVDQRFAAVDQRFEDLGAAIADAIENVHAVNESYFADHERRITKLESKHSC